MTGAETDGASTNASKNKEGTETDGVTASTDGGARTSVKTGASTNAGDDGSDDGSGDDSETERRTIGSDATGAASINTAKVGRRTNRLTL